MSSIEEKRVYDTSAGKTDVFVATGVGIARVECSGGLVGEFELVHRCTGTDIAATEGQIAVGTEADVLVWRGEEFVSAEFGPAIAIGFHDGLIAGGSTRIARYTEGAWTDLRVADQPSTVSSFAGPLVGTEDGVYRITNGELSSVGLENVRDVSVAGAPLAGTATGLYQLKNGWDLVLEKPVHWVESDGTRVYVGTDDGLFIRSKRSQGEPSNQYEQVTLPVSERIAGVAYGESTYAVTVDGTFLIESEGEWRARSIGLPDVCGLAVP